MADQSPSSVLRQAAEVLRVKARTVEPGMWFVIGTFGALSPVAAQKLADVLDWADDRMWWEPFRELAEAIVEATDV